MRLLFLGSGEFGLPTLEALAQHHELVGIVTQPDRPAGRKRQLTATPVGQWAGERDLPLFKPPDINDSQVIARIKACDAQAAVVIAFGQKLGQAVLATMGALAINLHASLLPRYRGAAPIQRAVMNAEAQTGVSVIGLAQRMDAGPVYAMAATAIDPLETAGQLHDRLAAMGPALILQVLEDLAHHRLNPAVQDETLATRAPKLTKDQGTVDFHLPARLVQAQVHGLTPWPGCTVNWHGQDGTGPRRLMLRRVAIEPATPASANQAPGTLLDNLRVQTGDGVVRLLELQAPGTRVMDAAAFAAGHHFQPGDRLQSLD